MSNKMGGRETTRVRHWCAMMSGPVQCGSGLPEAESIVNEFLPSCIWKNVGLSGRVC